MLQCLSCCFASLLSYYINRAHKRYFDLFFLCLVDAETTQLEQLTTSIPTSTSQRNYHGKNEQFLPRRRRHLGYTGEPFPSLAIVRNVFTSCRFFSPAKTLLSLKRTTEIHQRQPVAILPSAQRFDSSSRGRELTPSSFTRV